MKLQAGRFICGVAGSNTSINHDRHHRGPLRPVETENVRTVRFSNRLTNQLISAMNQITIKAMRNAIRTVKSYSIEPDIDQYVKSTKGKQSASERVNELLRRAVEEEQQEALAREASAFFSKARNRRRTGARAFQKASMRTLTRGD